MLGRLRHAGGLKGLFFFIPVLEGLGIMFIYMSPSVMFLSGHFMLIEPVNCEHISGQICLYESK